MPAGRWRVALTVLAWLLILQAGSGALSAGLGLMLLPASAATAVPGGEKILPGAHLLGPMISLLRAAVGVGAVLSLALLAGAVGLLRRRRWGWYVVIAVSAIGAGGLLAVLPTVFGTVLEMAAPRSSPLLPWALSLLAVLPALALIGFLLLDPVLRQFEPSG